MHTDDPQISVIIATHNRRDVLSQTLEVLDALPCRSRLEVIVVDNNSSDGTLEVAQHRADRVHARPDNLGSCAKDLAIQDARGDFVLFLDDDSTPHPHSLVRMTDIFKEEPTLGALGFRVDLPDGRQEGGALPGVPLGCGVGFRKSALLQVDGIARDFFMQAEEYDWSFRLVQSGWKIAMTDELVVDHRKTPVSRVPARTLYFDTRNNLRVVQRYLPDHARPIYWEDWKQRYGWFASLNSESGDDYLDAFKRGVTDVETVHADERAAFADSRLQDHAFEYFFRWTELREWAFRLRDAGTRSVSILGFGKNIYAFTQALRAADLEITGISDHRLAAPDRTYRGLPLRSVSASSLNNGDAILIGDMASVHAAATHRRHLEMISRPVHVWTLTDRDYAMVEHPVGRFASI